MNEIKFFQEKVYTCEELITFIEECKMKVYKDLELSKNMLKNNTAIIYSREYTIKEIEDKILFLDNRCKKNNSQLDDIVTEFKRLETAILLKN